MDILIVSSKILLIGITAYLLYRVFYHLIDKLRGEEILDDQVFIILREVSKWLLVLLAGLFVVQQFGIETSRIATALSAIFVLVAVGFVAVWSVLSNILCAFLLLFFPPFRFGDHIELKEPDKENGFSGKVVGLSLFFTTLESNTENKKEKKLIKIPNTMFFQRVTTCHEGSETQDLKLKKTHRNRKTEK